MKAVQISAFGNPLEVARLVEVPEPSPPGPRDVKLEIESSPINPSDLFMMTGRYGHRPRLPATMGSEGVGRVIARGSDVRHLKEGDRVLVPYQSPTWIQRANVEAKWLFPLPPGDVDQFATLGINPATAYLLLTTVRELRPGDWLIQNGANSSVGRAIIAVAKFLGLKTVYVVRRLEVVPEIEALGGDIVLLDGPDLGTRVAQATGKARIHLGLDVVGDLSSLNITGCLADGGILVSYGAVSGKPFVNAAPHLIFRNVSIRGFWLVSWFSNAPAAAIRAMYETLIPLVTDGLIGSNVSASFSLQEVDRALVAAGKSGGKVMFHPQKVSGPQNSDQ